LSILQTVYETPAGETTRTGGQGDLGDFQAGRSCDSRNELYPGLLHIGRTGFDEGLQEDLGHGMPLLAGRHIPRLRARLSYDCLGFNR
jgi:hypothetical protein